MNVVDTMNWLNSQINDIHGLAKEKGWWDGDRTFEAITNKLGAQNAVAAGGRYDGLIKNLGGPDIPGLGFAIGLERLISLIPQEREFSHPLSLYIATLGDAAKRKALQLANGLRIMGIKTEMDYTSRSLKSQMRWANKMNAGLVLIIGDNELALGKVVLRDMVQKTQEEIPVDRVIEEIASRKKRNTEIP